MIPKVTGVYGSTPDKHKKQEPRKQQEKKKEHTFKQVIRDTFVRSEEAKE